MDIFLELFHFCFSWNTLTYFVKKICWLLVKIAWLRALLSSFKLEDGWYTFESIKRLELKINNTKLIKTAVILAEKSDDLNSLCAI